MKTILIFEPLTGGHRANYIRWLADSIRNNPPIGCRFIFTVASESVPASSAAITFNEVPVEIAARLSVAGRRERNHLLWKIFLENCERFKPDHVLILELTHLELRLALAGAPCPVSAILFVQYPEMRRGVKFFLKEFKTALLLRAPVKNLFLLNGEAACRYLTGRFNSRTRFVAIPDPVPEITAEANYSLRHEYRIPSNRTVFLFFGAISPRKGADVLIKALEVLPVTAALQSAFIFCGKPEHSYRETFQNACAHLRSTRPDIMLNVENRFVSDERMMALFEQSDVVLMPYVRPEYSSGILALAAKARTPVIGPDAGLLGRLIRENGLGCTCSATANSLADAIAEAVTKRPAVDQERCESFVKKSCPAEFSRVILGALKYEG